jgi:hypothetical protein
MGSGDAACRTPSAPLETSMQGLNAGARRALDALLGGSVGDTLGAYWEGSNPALSPRELQPRLASGRS